MTPTFRERWKTVFVTYPLVAVSLILLGMVAEQIFDLL